MHERGQDDRLIHLNCHNAESCDVDAMSIMEEIYARSRDFDSCEKTSLLGSTCTSMGQMFPRIGGDLPVGVCITEVMFVLFVML